jgi:hypothetical protein
MQTATRMHSANLQELTKSNSIATVHVEALQGELATARVRSAGAVSVAIDDLTLAVKSNATQVQDLQTKSEANSVAFTTEATTTGGEVQKGTDLRTAFLAEERTTLDSQLQGLHGGMAKLLKAQSTGRVNMLSGAKELQVSLSATAAAETAVLKVAETHHSEALVGCGKELAQHRTDGTKHTENSKDILRHFCDEEVQMATDAMTPAALEEIPVSRAMASTPADEILLEQNKALIDADFASLATGIDTQVIEMNTEEGENVPRSARKTPKRPALASIDNTHSLRSTDPMSAKKVDSLLMSPSRLSFKSPAVKRQKTALPKPTADSATKRTRVAGTGMRQPSQRN